ncbi:hypothetical protein [Acidovorax sp.]|uniref:hypothetical protein n=1 Tax=Acidovorax sp. TaxID=1872122 RepID=UPI002FA5281E
MATLSACGGGGDSATLGIESAQASESNMELARQGQRQRPSATTSTQSTTTSDTVTTTETVTTDGTVSTTTVSTLPPAPTPIANVPFSCAAGAITCVEVASTSSQAQASLPVTFGQPFKAGDWQHTTQGLVAQVGGATIPLQADEISSHRDGSARFAVLSAQLSNVQPGEARIINIFPGAKSSSTPSVPASPDWNLELEAQVYDASGNVTATLVAQPQAQLATQITNNTGRRLAGAVATEYTVALPFKNKATGTPHPHLSARLHTRLLDGGQRIRTDVVMENTRTWTASPGNITYSFAVKRNGSTIYTQPKFTHYHHARWHKVLWTGASAEPLARVRHNMPYFLASKAVWNYNLNLTIPETVLAENLTRLNQKRTEQAALGPMANLMLEPYFPMTGGRPDIGPYPQWTAMYLISQDERAREVMFSVSDAASSAPIHYRDETSDQVLDVERYPSVTVKYGNSSPALPTVSNGTTIWTPDTAHQASFAYVPYLISGDAFYLDEMLFWAGWNISSVNPSYREGAKGLIYIEQVRGQAWAMRSIGEAYRALPDTHAMKGYFQTQLTNNLNWYAAKYPESSQATVDSPLQAIIKGDEPHLTGPWQNDMMGIVFAQLAENADPKALETLRWFSGFNVGRFMNESQGFCIAKAPGYYFKIKNSSNQPLSTWGSLLQENFPGMVCDSSLAIDGYPDWGAGYAAYARAMLATAATLGVPNAAQAYSMWVSKTPKMDASFAQEPAWAIVPR